MALAALVYAAGVRRMRRRWPVWRTTLFLAGLFAVLLALVSGIDLLATQLFSVHMVQHMLLTVVAAPLITLGAPIRVDARLQPIKGSEGTLPADLVLFAMGFSGPLEDGPVRELGLAPVARGRFKGLDADERIHVAEHAWFLVTALVFWSVVIDPEPFRGTLGYAARLPYLLVAGAAQNTVLGGILSFSSRLLYQSYARGPERFGVDPLTDQRIGGAVMWVTGDLIFLAAASVSFFLWLEQEEAQQLRREQRERALRSP